MSRAGLVTQFALVRHLYFAYLIQAAFALPMNVTVDDTYGDPITGTTFFYSPSSVWSTGHCPACTAPVDDSLAYNHTWHDVSWASSVVYHFESDIDLLDIVSVQ